MLQHSPKLMKMPFKIQEKHLFQQKKLILLDKALSIERKEVSLRSEIFVIYISKSRRNEKE